MKIRIDHITIIFGVILLTSCSSDQSELPIYQINKFITVKSFGNTSVIADPTIFDGRLWVVDVIMDADTIHFDTLDPIMNITQMDINGDGILELYFTTQCVGSGSYGEMYGVTKDSKGKTYQILFPEYQERTGFDSLFTNYGGKDNYKFEQNQIIRIFPRYDGNDANCCPSLGEMILRDSLFIENGSYVMKPIHNQINEGKKYQ